ncbi:MAG: hypothetical protein U5K79_05695 [Cyclobacteriaceae bacterium]|nr:hypothetical protein [Cyclobacteriaceae bacterium]
MEALIAARSARELLDSYKKEIEDSLGPEVARQEINQLDQIFTTFESTLIDQLEPEEKSIPDSEIVQSEPAIETESFDGTELLGVNELTAAAPTATCTPLIKKRSLELAYAQRINNQLFIVDNTVGLQVHQQILNQSSDKNYGRYIVFSLVIFVLLIATWITISGIQKRSITEISNDLKHIAKGERPEFVSTKSNDLTSIVAASDDIVSYLDDAGKFAKKIGEGDFEYTFNPKSR